MFAMPWSHVTLTDSHQTVRVKGAIVKGTPKSTNKTKSSKRTVILTAKAVEALKKQQALTEGREDKHVWIREGEYGPFNDSDNLRVRWIRILQHAGVRYRVPYQMRHTYASQLLSGGENILFVAEMLGHADTEMCIKVYAKWIKEDSQKYQHKFVSKFGK